uniref:Reverse transcriptase domain-containing protein n=1 Tax=Nicotiana tabacum TaxID=4097 RepID=A0A1S3ZET5_TOBAC|nr:PREDICTED: uncharacterized protein LOC107785952 [Nicotiana tabacum]
MRPISLSNFSNKIISRVVHERLVDLLPSLISPNQAGFIKGRSIVENILLTQEIITDIRLRGKPSNVVIKLDMAKAYDRVSWLVLTKVLRQMGFGEVFTDMIFRLVSNNWYFVLLNGQANGFFKSSRDVKQGDLLSLSLFILAAEVLGRALDALFDNPNFIGFGMPKWSQNINYLSYADDTIIFCSSHYGAVHLTMKVLEEYGAASAGGRKSYIKASSSKFRRGYHHGKLHKMFARFYWSNSGNEKARHWASWDNMCLPKREGGLSFRSLHDLSKALFAKLWWTYGTKDTLWSTFLWNKYCKKINEMLVPWRNGSQVWKKMTQMREELEYQVWWQLKNGSSYFWYDNWTGLGALYHTSGTVHWCDESIKYVDEVMENGTWNEVLLRELLPEEIAEHILEKIAPPAHQSMKDKPWWKLETNGQFIVKSAWHYIRKRRDERKHPKEETLPHVFLTSPAARFVWNYFGTPVGIKTQGKQLVQLINEWWNKAGNTSLKAVYQAMPSLIVWHMWKRMNSGKHGKTVRRPGIKGVTTNWTDLHENLANHVPKLRYTKVMWQLPHMGWIKCNTDGACRGDNRGASYGFCIRDGIGDLIYAQANVVKEATNNIAEARAILEALRYIVQMPFPACIIETDSLLMNNVLDETWETPWSIANKVD